MEEEKVREKGKPENSTKFVEDDTSKYGTVDKRSTSGPDAPNERSQKLPFREKSKERITSGPGGFPSSFFAGNWGKNGSKTPDILLVVDLNSRNPTAAFYGPFLGYSHYKFLPALEAMSKARETFLTSTELVPSNSQFINSNADWTTDFLSHCRTLLELELGKPLGKFKLQISLTARGDTSDRDKASLLEIIKKAGFVISTEDAVQIFPTAEAVAIKAVHGLITLDSKNDNSYGAEDYNILVLHYDGDVAEIQSYSVSWAAATENKFAEFRLRLEEIVYGETIDCGKLIDHQFTRWLEKSFGSSVLNLSTNTNAANRQLMAEFAEVRRNYKIDQNSVYNFPLTLRNPAYGAPYDSSRHVCKVQDSEMQGFFEPAMDSLLQSLDSLYARVRQKKKPLDKVIFAGESWISPYVEDHLKDWGLGVGLLSTNLQVYPVQYIRFESMPETVVQGAIQGNYPGVEVVPRSRAHYGFKEMVPFRNEDPEWSRYRDPWDNIDRCRVRAIWQVQKDQLLDAHANVSAKLSYTIREDDALRGILELYKCTLDDPPQWVRIHENVSNRDMTLVGSITVNFTEQDFRDSERKLCDDQVFRRRFNVTARVLCGHRTRTLRVQVMSADQQRVLGRDVFRYD